MASNDGLEEDERLALELQEKYNNEEEIRRYQEKKDQKLAMSLAGVHSMSDSDSEQDENPDDPDTDDTIDPNEHVTPKKFGQNTLIDLFGNESDENYSPKKNRDKKISDLFGTDSDENATSSAMSRKDTAPIHFASDTDEEDDEILSSKRNGNGTPSKKLVTTMSKHDMSDSDDEISPKVPKSFSSKRTASKIHDVSDSDSENEIASKLQSTGKKNPKTSPHKSNLQVVPDSSPKDHKRKHKECADSQETRPVCEYGNRCYRKNPSHLKDFSHPGTSSTPESKRRKTDYVAGSLVYSTPSDTAEVIQHSQPLSFLLTKVTGIDDQHNAKLAINIKEILSPSLGNLEKSAQFNYCIDIPWLVSQYHHSFRTKPVLVVHGSQREEKKALENDAKPFAHVKLCQAKLEILFGTHHTKMMLLLYDNGLRIIIHTANLVQQDWHQKTQGVWISPLYPALPQPSSTMGDSETHFKADILEYLKGYKAQPLQEWIDVVKQHDLSETRVYLIGSIPGRHTGSQKNMWGHMKFRRILHQHGPDPKLVRDWPVIGQFSSVGSLGSTKEQWICGEWLASIGSTQGSAGGLSSTSTKLKLVFPSKENIRTSLEGYPAGGSVPYSIKVAKKQPYLRQFWHHWYSELRGRSRASPHIKTYQRVSPDCTQLAWFLVTSANMSKAAWGALEKGGTQLMIRSYELGVLFLPESFGSSDTFRVLGADVNKDAKELVFPVPYDLPPTPYSKSDHPWVWDIPYMDKPDTHGNMWCPAPISPPR